MTHTHTESPWHLGNRAGNPAIYGKDGTEIAEILQCLTPEWRENAHLIAAAPEMLEALQAVAVGLSPASLELQKDSLADLCRTCSEIIQEAIAKAEGKA
jgi:hypothetical protein